ncbi:unnamed protein product [Adineta ricciae]|uniref:Uncharacterized protein n=1 Tax=Adineta ricciae TaxID=249248 RepID=A0A813QE81_ADIRI|nr:unnamed protein product [Adineta ricciae]
MYTPVLFIIPIIIFNLDSFFILYYNTFNKRRRKIVWSSELINDEIDELTNERKTKITRSNEMRSRLPFIAFGDVIERLHGQ